VCVCVLFEGQVLIDCAVYVPCEKNATGGVGF